MDSNLMEKSVQYKFANTEKYGDKKVARELKHLKADASDEAINKVGASLAKLQGDNLKSIVEISKRDIEITD